MHPNHYHNYTLRCELPMPGIAEATFPMGAIVTGQEKVNTSPTNSLFMVIEAAFLTFNPAI